MELTIKNAIEYVENLTEEGFDVNKAWSDTIDGQHVIRVTFTTVDGYSGECIVWEEEDGSLFGEYLLNTTKP